MHIISQPVIIEDDDWRFEGSQNLIFVLENRKAPQSRQIALHYFRFPAKGKPTLPPVIFLGAGPGEPYSVEVFFQGKRAEAWRFELAHMNQHRDVILINQRGNVESPGLPISHFRYKWNNSGSLDRGLDLSERNENRRLAYSKAIQQFEQEGIDVKGYDYMHFIDDIEVVRRACGYEKIALVGNSFGSQWALGYIQKYPDHVDRALLSGVEPIDHNYDDPDHIWNVFKRIDSYASADPAIADHLPEGGLTAAFKSIISRLENQPQTVTIKDEDGQDIQVVVGADDLRFLLLYRNVKTYKEEIEAWPKYIMEMYHGDYRLLALLSIGRLYNSSSGMINTLVNNSIGISSKREQQLASREANQWLGDINNHFTSTRDVCPTSEISDTFRTHVQHNIPIVMVHGDMDLSTPYENAKYLLPYLKNGHLLTVKRGFHNAKRTIIFADEVLRDKLYRFMDIDFEKSSFQEFRKTLPSVYEMPEFQFRPIGGKSFYEVELGDRGS